MKRVAITGVGAVSALGHDAATLWDAVVAGRTGIAPIANIPTDRLNVKVAAEVKGFDGARYFDARRLPMMDRATRFAVVAAREAIAQSGVPLGRQRGSRAGVILGSTGGWATVDDSYEQFYGKRVNRLSPFTISKIMGNAAASHITIEHGIRGATFAISSACASASHAIGLAFHMIRGGGADVMIAGGSDASILPGYLKGWDAMRILSPDVCRPFSKNRNGLVIGEGAGILVLENLEMAQARGARILAELIGFGMNADGMDLTASDAASAADAMSQALEDGGIAPDAVDYVNAHGTGTRLNDLTESAALRRVFGERLATLPVSSTKSMFGHNLAAAGALEMIVTTLALGHGIAPPTLNYDERDPECDIDCVPAEARAVGIDIALSNSFAFGGLNAVLLARRAPS